MAAIDIGSNAVRLLIKRINTLSNDEKKIKKTLLLRVPLRLGFDVFSTGKLSKEKSMKLERLMKSFRQLMIIYDVDIYRACATSAMRDAKNGKRIIQHISRKTDIQVEIISGQEEARIVYGNHLECLEDRSGNFMYVDVGGGSTEVNLLVDGELRFSASYNIGTGGNINKLYRLAEQKDKKQKNLPVASLRKLYDELSALTPAERTEIYELKEDRADVIVPAGEIFLRIAETVGAAYIHVPVIGLADGIIDELCVQKEVSSRQQ